MVKYDNFILQTLRLEAKKLLQGKKNPQRAHIHSQVIFTQLTNMISTDSLKVELPESLTITKVKMESDFSRLNIYWLGTGSDEDEPMQSRLDALAFDLRHELQQLGVIGNIPPIKFICDLSQAKLTEINRLLSRADFGEEFDPKTTLQGMLSDAVLQKRPVIPSSPEGSHNKAIEKIANDSKEKKADIFGLDRTRLYNKVLQRKQKNSEEVEEHQQMSEEITSPVVDFQKRLKEYRRFGEVQKKEKRKKVSGRFDDDSESIGNL